jgi:hypothetical protein
MESPKSLDDYIVQPDITLYHGDKRYTLPRPAVLMSAFLKGALECDSNATEIPIFYEKANLYLAHIVEYLSHHNGIAQEKPDPLGKKQLKDCIRDEWDFKFITSNRWIYMKEFMEFLDLVKYMQIESLIQLCCLKIADLIRSVDVARYESIIQNRSRLYDENYIEYE